SACAMAGKVLAYSRKSTKKNPIVPMKIPISTKVGENMVQEEVNLSLLKSTTMISNLSNHIPILMIRATIKVQTIFLLNFFIHSVWGTIRLQVINAQNAHQ